MYKTGLFTFSFDINQNFPHDPPKVRCQQKIYHPNIDLEGKVCLNILREDLQGRYKTTEIKKGGKARGDVSNLATARDAVNESDSVDGKRKVIPVPQGHKKHGNKWEKQSWGTLRRAMPPNVTVHSRAMSGEEGDAFLTVPCYTRPIEGMGSLTPGFNGIFGNARQHTTFRVPCTTLDAYAGQDIGFVKIDVEGHEQAVLAGGKMLIEQQQPVVLIEVEEIGDTTGLAFEDVHDEHGGADLTPSTWY